MAFFDDRAPGRPGLALFLNCGDPPLDVFKELVLALDEAKVDCLELAIPFPNSPSDGPVIRESASRALERGVRHALYIEEMFSTGHDAANRAVVAECDPETAKVVGVGLRADKKIIDKITKGARMHP